LFNKRTSGRLQERRSLSASAILYSSLRGIAPLKFHSAFALAYESNKDCDRLLSPLYYAAKTGPGAHIFTFKLGAAGNSWYRITSA